MAKARGLTTGHKFAKEKKRAPLFGLSGGESEWCIPIRYAVPMLSC